jgi:hypothetical protein
LVNELLQQRREGGRSTRLLVPRAAAAGAAPFDPVEPARCG